MSTIELHPRQNSYSRQKIYAGMPAGSSRLRAEVPLAMAASREQSSAAGVVKLRPQQLGGVTTEFVGKEEE